MPISRIYCPIELYKNLSTILSPAASHHLAEVLRAKVGMSFIVFNGQDDEFYATITAIHRKQVSIIIQERVQRSSPESSINIHIGQSISRSERMDFAIQKAVELGVTTITPLITEYCAIKLDPQRYEQRLQHWHNIIISACEQSGRVKIPKLHLIKPLITWLEENQSHPGIVCSLGKNATAFSAITPFNSSHQDEQKTINVLIGPEGGLSSRELLEVEKKYQYWPLSLGPRILRTETATVTVLTLIQHHWGDLS